MHSPKFWGHPCAMTSCGKVLMCSPSRCQLKPISSGAAMHSRSPGAAVDAPSTSPSSRKATPQMARKASNRSWSLKREKENMLKKYDRKLWNHENHGILGRKHGGANFPKSLEGDPPIICFAFGWLLVISHCPFFVYTTCWLNQWWYNCHAWVRSHFARQTTCVHLHQFHCENPTSCFCWSKNLLVNFTWRLECIHASLPKVGFVFNI